MNPRQEEPRGNPSPAGESSPAARVSSEFIYLASRSPRRRALLEQIGVKFRALDVNADETRRPGESPAELVRRLACLKAQRGWSQVADAAPAPVLGADTVVTLGEHCLGKPEDREQARAMLAMLSGRCHRVLSGVAVCWQGRTRTHTNDSEVCFRSIAEQELRAYCETDEPLDKAGAYAIQGLGAVFVSRITGSHSGVMGLPLYETGELLREVGVEVIVTRDA